MLTIIILAFLWSPLLIQKFLPEDESGLDAFATRTSKFLKEKQEGNAQYDDRNWSRSAVIPLEQQAQANIKPFNPNLISQQEWLAMGCPRWLAERIMKFRSKGGTFRQPEDLHKIYGMPEDLFLRMAPFLVFSESENQAISTSKLFKYIELNRADSAMLSSIQALRPYMVSRILKYRNRLGGFFQISQLSEVYGMNEGNLKEISVVLTIDTTAVRKLNINTCDFKEIMKHPYGGYVTAKAICKFREKYGLIRAIGELRQSAVIPDSCFWKIAPYLVGS